MRILAQNLKKLRKYKKLSQAALSEQVGLTRSSLNAYENDLADPSITTLLRLADFFRVSLDRLLRQDMDELTEFELRKIAEGYDIDIQGKQLRILSTTVDPENKEHIELVPAQARAGYTTGYADPEFIRELPKMHLPFLPGDRTYRIFPIIGDSMPPVSEGSYVIGEYLDDWTHLKNDTPCIVVTLEDGIVFKNVHNFIESRGALQLCSTNPAYEPYEVPIREVLEIWKFVQYISTDLPEPNLDKSIITATLLKLQQEVNALKKDS